jgi:hypothetical protein
MLGVGGYFLYQYWVASQDLDVWDLVPESAAIVFESTKSVENWNEVQSKAVWQNLEQIPYYSGIRTKVEQLDSLSGQEGRLHQLLQSKPFVFSIHRISRQELGYVFFVPINDLEDLEVFNTLVNQYQSRDDFKFRTRTYQNITIHEAVNQEYEEVFSYILHQGHFIGSFTPFLVEDVIRNIGSPSPNSFALTNPKMFEVAKLDNDQGNLYINIEKVPELFSAFLDENESPTIASLGDLAKSSFLDVKLTDDKVLFNGFTLTENEDHPYLESVGGFQGGEFGLASVLSNDAAMVYHLTFDDPNRWHSRLRSYWKQHDQPQLEDWQKLQQVLDWDPLSLISLQQREMALATMGTIEDEEADKLVYFYTDSLDPALNQLLSVAQKAAEAAGGELYTEAFAQKQITQINLSDFPAKIWGGMFGGFEQCFFMPVENFIVFSSSVSGLKRLEQAIAAEDIWGKSIVRNEFLSNSLKEANLSLFVNLSKSWNILKQRLSGDWQSFLDLHIKTLNKFELLAIQFSDIGDKFYTSAVITYSVNNRDIELAPRFSNNQQVYTESPIISKPFVVANHNNGSKEVLIQDSLKNLYLIGSQGRLLWRDSLGGAIRGGISQIDFYRNNKLQYLLATEQEIHIIDRNGNPVEGYPIIVPTETRLRHVGVIDYDNSGRYRFITSDESGAVFMYDKLGKLLEGWNPKVLPDQLLYPPEHIRIRGRDCIIAVLESGQVHVMNRRGELYPGFPVDLQGPADGPLFIDQGTDFSKTVFNAVNRNGLIVKFDLNGKVFEKQQLIKPTVDTYFQLCLDPLGRHYVIKRQNANRLGVLNRKGEVLFEKDYLSTSNLMVQYYLLGNNHSVYAVTDPVQQFTYFYNQRGELINSTPIESANEIAMLYFESQRQHQIYSVYESKFALLSF